MKLRSTLSTAMAALATALVLGAPSAGALGLKDCSDKFSAEKAAGSAAGKKNWNEFRKSECGPNAKPATPAAAGAPAAAAAPAKPAAPAATAAPAPAPAPAVAPAGPVKGKKSRAAKVVPTGPVLPAVFPGAISEAYKAKKPAKARLATCLDQYRTNKATNANGGLRWIQKGGGYYSQCNKKLKA